MVLFLRNRCSFWTRLSRQLSGRIVKSKVTNVEIPQVNLNDFIWKNLDQWHDKTALVCAETQRSYRYSDVYTKSKKLATFLISFPALRKGDVVVTILPNIPEYQIVVLGVIQAGFKLTSVNSTYTKDEIKRQLEDSNAKFIFTLTEASLLILSVTETLPLKNIPVVFINHSHEHMSVPSGGIKFKDIFEKDYRSSFSSLGFNDVAFIPYSSGTTGFPKGVQLTNANMVSALYNQTLPEFNVPPLIAAGSQHVVPMVLPMFHIYGSMVTLFNLSIGSKIVTLSQFSLEKFVKLLKTFKPTFGYVVPPIINMLINSPLVKTEDITHMRKIVYGAAPFGVNDLEMFEQKTQGKVSLVQGYGLTETAGITHLQSTEISCGLKRGGIGLTFPNLECKIVSAAGDDNTGLGPNQQGELLTRGPQIFKGYLNKQPSLDPEGWYRTGDVCYYDEDEHFFITDRLKELIKVNAFQVAPAELEEILRSHPDVIDAAVIGVPHSVCGEVPKAFIVAREKSSTICKNVQEYMSTKVVKHKQLLGGIVVVDSIPKSASGKILRKLLKDDLNRTLLDMTKVSGKAYVTRWRGVYLLYGAKIVKLVSGKGMKDGVAYLFKMMGVMPANRRMSVMPGVAPVDAKKPTATIMPTTKRTTDAQPSARILQAVSKSSDSEGGAESKRGVEFLDLIKYHID